MSRRGLLPLASCLVPFVILSAWNSAGYRYGASDQAFYVPAALSAIDPTLYPRDRELIAAQASLTFADETVAALAWLTRARLPPLLAALYAGSLALLAAAAWLIGQQLYRRTWTAIALLAALTLRHAIARTGTNSLEGYFHPRQLAFGFGALAIAAVLRGRLLPAGACVLLAACMHPTTACWFAIWIAVAAAVTDRRMRMPLLATGVVGAATGAWALTAGPLAGRLVVMDPAWLATLVTKDYLFPLDWPAYVWLINLGYIPVILLLYRHRARSGLTVAGEAGVVAGCLSLVLVFAAALPFNAARVAIAIQLQIPRVFWMLDLLATVYAVWALAEWTGGAARRARLTAVIIVLLSMARGGYVIFLRFPDRAAFQVEVKDNDWGRVMEWARTAQPGAGWLADPMHAVRYGTSVRMAGQDVYVEAIKDTAIGMYDRNVAIQTRDRLGALGDFASLTPEQGRRLASAYGLDYLVTDGRLDLPVVFQAGLLYVYRIAGSPPGR